MKRGNEYITEYNNGNLTIKYDDDLIKEAQKDWAGVFASVLEAVDVYFVGEEFCISNYAMGVALYNCYSDNAYILDFRQIDELHAGKMIRLHAIKDPEVKADIQADWEREYV